MAVRIEDAGFEIRDMIAWVYGSGFPKSLNIGKAVDKLQGNKREDLGWNSAHINRPQTENWKKSATEMNHGKFKVEGKQGGGLQHITKGTSPYEGWGTALKPALEPITVARKPLSEKTVAENVLKYGTGGINIDGSRVGSEERHNPSAGNKDLENRHTVTPISKQGETEGREAIGRFPANLIHDGSDEVVELFPNSKSSDAVRHNNPHKSGSMAGATNGGESFGFKDSGSAARFFYCAKASNSERNIGCEELPIKQSRGGGGLGESSEELLQAAKAYGSVKAPNNNFHPTVKPIALMEYLVKLVSRENAIVLDPFAGSGSTLVACKKLKRNYIGCELDEEYIKISEARLSAVKNIQISLL
jgi:site-specific DNA-methyltransferase (adenine-specific)